MDYLGKIKEGRAQNPLLLERLLLILYEHFSIGIMLLSHAVYESVTSRLPSHSTMTN